MSNTHFAELDSNNNVIGVYTFDSNDFTQFGTAPATGSPAHAETIRPLSENAVKYVESSETGAFRQRHAMIDGTYDETKNVFINKKPHASWVLDAGNEWVPPIPLPNNLNYTSDGQTYTFETYMWDEDIATFRAKEAIEADFPPEWIWDKTNLVWNLDS